MAILKNFISFADSFSRAPVQAAADAAERPSAGLGFSGYALGALSMALWSQLLWGESGGLLHTLDLALLLMVCNILAALLCAGLSNLFLEFSGARGRSLGLFVIFGLSEGMKTLLIPAALVLMAFGAAGFAPFLLIAVLAAQLACAIGLMARVYRVTRFQAFMALAFPGMLAFLIVFLSFSVFVVWALTGLKTAMPV